MNEKKETKNIEADNNWGPWADLDMETWSYLVENGSDLVKRFCSKGGYYNKYRIQIRDKIANKGILYVNPDDEKYGENYVNYFFDVILHNQTLEIIQIIIYDYKKFMHAISDKNTFNDLIKKGVFKIKNILGENCYIGDLKELFNEGFIVKNFRKEVGIKS